MHVTIRLSYSLQKLTLTPPTMTLSPILIPRAVRVTLAETPSRLRGECVTLWLTSSRRFIRLDVEADSESLSPDSGTQSEQ